jgi:hypothetical protein
MKTFALVALALLAAGPALAQGTADAYRASNTRAGGPAYLLNSETGGPVQPVRKRKVARSISGQHAGGPANDLNTGGTGSLSTQGTVYDPTRTVPFGTAASGQRAGGPYRQ